MTKPISIGVVLAMYVSPTCAAEQYWIVHQSINLCSIVEKNPRATQ